MFWLILFGFLALAAISSAFTMYVVLAVAALFVVAMVASWIAERR